IDLVFLLVAGLAVIALVVTVFIKEIPLRTMSGIQAMAESEAGDAVTDAVPAEITTAVAPVPDPMTEELDAIDAFGDPLPTGRHALPSGTGTPVTGRVRRSDDTPAAGAVLTLINHGGQQVARGTTVDDGSYELVAPLDGSYVLIASSAGHQPQASTLRVAGDPVALDVLLTGTARATGVVRNGTGPIPGAVVTLTDPRGEVVGSVNTGDDGWYRFADLLGGRYTLVVSAPRYRPYATSLAVPDLGDAVTEVVLSGGARLTGTATGGPDRRPIRDARVTLVDTSGTVVGMTTTDDTGGYSFGDLPAGEYTVIASGYPPVSAHHQVGAGEDGVHDVVLDHSDI
ncbi:MAG TPA: carboxypeptidase-like regulatory domain-containing protein, partial [Pseudonocardiaceae bacterium]|nr:carboxypeptidase-like regulatory domain-containing protein [Pseudonocardiaceae bacterium]